MAGELEKRLVVLEPNKVLRGIYLALLIGGPLLFLAALLGVSPLGFIGGHLTVLGAILFTAHRRYNQRATKKERQVRATAAGIFVDGNLAVPRAQIADGFYQPRRTRSDEKYQSSVRVVDKRRRISFEAECPDEDEALAFLRALGLDPGSRRAEFRGGSPLFATVGRQIATIFGTMFGTLALSSMLAAIYPPLGGAFALTFLPVLFLSMWSSKITIGVDGVLVRWFWMRRFYPMKDIRAVSEADDNAIHLILQNFESRIIYTSMRHKQTGSPLMQNNRDAVLARIREAQQRFREGGNAADATALVARGTKKRREWLDALQKLARTEGGYREAVVRHEDLLRIVEDPHASEDARAGAAFVLRTTADEDVRARVRVAAEASASPKLRVALDAAAKNDATKIDEAMRELGAEDDDDEAKRARA